MSLKIYDISIDTLREVTQEDVDKLEKAAAAFGIWRTATQALLKVTLEMAQGKRPLTNLVSVIIDAKPPYSEAAE